MVFNSTPTRVKLLIGPPENRGGFCWAYDAARDGGAQLVDKVVSGVVGTETRLVFLHCTENVTVVVFLHCEENFDHR